MQLNGAATSHRPLTHADISVTHTVMLLTPVWPWEKSAQEIQKCWPWLPSLSSVHTAPMVALCLLLPQSLILTPPTEKKTQLGGCSVPGCWVCLQAPSHCLSLPFCVHGVSSACTLFGAETACLHIALMDSVLCQLQGTIRINVSNNSSDKQHQH